MGETGEMIRGDLILSRDLDRKAIERNEKDKGVKGPRMHEDWKEDCRESTRHR